MAKGDDTKGKRKRCAAKTAGGQRCRGTALEGSTTCWHHQFAVPGRPTKLTPDVVEVVINTVLEGNYLEVAAQAAGINKTTLYRWLRRGDELEAAAMEHVDEDANEVADVYSHTDPGEWVYLDFRHALKSAEAYSEIELLRGAKTGAPGWQASMTVLERRHPQRWRRRDTHTVELEGAENVAAVNKVTPPEEKRAEVAGILAAAGALDEPAPENTNDEEDPHEDHD